MSAEDGGGWEAIGGSAPHRVISGGVEIGRGTRVRLLPRARADGIDAALAGRTGIVESLEEDVDGSLHLAVTVTEDPGSDLGHLRLPGHRFFFSLEEVEPLPPGDGEAGAAPRVLVAGIGNIFLGDDAFGVEVARRLALRELPAGVRVIDFGIRGMDLAYALGECDVAVLVDAAPRGEAPGTLAVLEPDLEDLPEAIDGHGMDPVKVLALARALGGLPERVLLVVCEPAARNAAVGELEMDIDELEKDIDIIALSEPVRAAVDPAIALTAELVESLIAAARDLDRRTTR